MADKRHAEGTGGSERNPQMGDEQRRILLIALVPLFMSLLSVSIVNVVLPAIGTSLEASNTALQWALTGYALTFGVFLVPAGRAGDLFGRGKLFIAGLAVFGLSSLLSGIAPNPFVLNIARLLMGVGSGLLNPQVIGLIQQYFSGASRGRAFGLMGSVVGVSVALGPTLGGVLIRVFGDDLGWRMSFLINVPIAILAVVLAVTSFPRSAWEPPVVPAAPSPSPTADDAATAGNTSATASAGTAPRRAGIDLDLIGVALLGLGTLCILVPLLLGRATLGTGALGLLGIVLIIGWVLWEAGYKRRGRSPMVDMDLFRTRSFANGSLLISMYFFGTTSVWVVLAVYAQNGLGFTALQAGLIGLPAAILSAISSSVAGRYIVRIGRPLVLFGMAMAIFGLLAGIGAVIMHDSAGWPFALVVTAVSFIGLAQGLVISPNQTLSLTDVPLNYAGAAGGVLQTGQRIGTAMGLAVVTSVFFAVQAAAGWTTAFSASFAVIAFVVTASAVVGIIDWIQGRASAAADPS